nr:gamma-glutamylcyclotransferase family protein [Ammonifex thiophilus]
MGAGTVWYFAYGSNMSAARMRERVGEVGGWEERIPGVLEEWRLVFNKVASRNPREGFANIEPSAGERVEGCLYRLSESVLERLDRYEGMKSGHFKRMQVTVIRKDTGESVITYTHMAWPE